MTIREDEKELNMDKNMDWIYRTVPMDPDLEKTLEAVEKALGFKLFVWQKTYIEHGYFRQYGATTAEILRELLNVSEAPLDYICTTSWLASRKARNGRNWSVVGECASTRV